LAARPFTSAIIVVAISRPHSFRTTTNFYGSPDPKRTLEGDSSRPADRPSKRLSPHSETELRCAGPRWRVRLVVPCCSSPPLPTQRPPPGPRRSTSPHVRSATTKRRLRRSSTGSAGGNPTGDHAGDRAGRRAVCAWRLAELTQRRPCCRRPGDCAQPGTAERAQVGEAQRMGEADGRLPSATELALSPRGRPGACSTRFSVTLGTHGQAVRVRMRTDLPMTGRILGA
jgi:hypothetical protein